MSIIITYYTTVRSEIFMWYVRYNLQRYIIFRSRRKINNIFIRTAGRILNADVNTKNLIFKLENCQYHCTHLSLCRIEIRFYCQTVIVLKIVLPKNFIVVKLVLSLQQTRVGTVLSYAPIRVHLCCTNYSNQNNICKDCLEFALSRCSINILCAMC